MCKEIVSCSDLYPSNDKAVWQPSVQSALHVLPDESVALSVDFWWKISLMVRIPHYNSRYVGKQASRYRNSNSGQRLASWLP